MKLRFKILFIALLGQLLSSTPGTAGSHRFIILASTTSTDNSGLFRHVLPKFTADSGIAVRVVAVGTGAALRLAARGDADVVLVHARQQEERFVAQGHGIRRRAVMYNDFILVGPNSDPARIRGQADPVKALALIHQSKSIFASRGDKSGTHSKELALWREAGLEPERSSGRWYLETGSGMGATLNLAAAREAYTLSDRATWLSFNNKRGLVLLLEGNKRLNNPYGVIVVNPAKHPGVKIKDATDFADWLTGNRGQAAIASFRARGRQVFFPNAK
jgi:tungstate transport system substrate-binding protein